MTLDTDFMQFAADGRVVGRVMCKQAGVEWPPPEFVNTPDGLWRRESYSQWSDDVADHPNLARGALYVPVDGQPS